MAKGYESFIQSSLIDGFETYKNNFFVSTANTILWILSIPLCVITVVGIIFIPGFFGGYLKSMLDLARGEEVSIGGFFRVGYNNFGSVLGLDVLKYLGLALAFLLLVIPAIYLGVAWTFAIVVLMDTSFGVVESLKYSRSLVKGRWWDVFLFYLILMIIGVFFKSLMILFIPYSTFAYLHYYLKVRGQKDPITKLTHEQAI